MKKSHPGRKRGIKWGEPYDCPIYLPGESFQVMAQEGWSQIDPWVEKAESGRQSHLEFAGLSTGEERATQRENLRD